MYSYTVGAVSLSLYLSIPGSLSENNFSENRFTPDERGVLSLTRYEGPSSRSSRAGNLFSLLWIFHGLLFGSGIPSNGALERFAPSAVHRPSRRPRARSFLSRISGYGSERPPISSCPSGLEFRRLKSFGPPRHDAGPARDDPIDRARGALSDLFFAPRPYSCVDENT